MKFDIYVGEGVCVCEYSKTTSSWRRLAVVKRIRVWLTGGFNEDQKRTAESKQSKEKLKTALQEELKAEDHFCHWS